MTMARLVLLPYTSVFKNRKQGQDAVPICNQRGSQSKQGSSERPGQGEKKGGPLALTPSRHMSRALNALWTG